MSTHNGFILNYDGPFFPAARSNSVTYDCFCLMGGLSNARLTKFQHQNGTEIYYTYHRIDKR